MNTEYIQNLRYKLQKCVRRLNSMVQQTFHFSLKQFQGFLKSYPIFVGILEHINRQEGEQIKMQEEDRNRYKILIAGGTEVFERLEENIFNLNTRNITLSGIILATVSIFFNTIIILASYGDTLFNGGLDFNIHFPPSLGYIVSYDSPTLNPDKV